MSEIRTETQLPSGPVDHIEHIHNKYRIEQEMEVDRNDRSQRNPKFNPQPPGIITPGTHVKVKPKGPKEPSVQDQELTKANKKDLKNRNLK